MVTAPLGNMNTLGLSNSFRINELTLTSTVLECVAFSWFQQLAAQSTRIAPISEIQASLVPCQPPAPYPTQSANVQTVTEILSS